ncbi:hypothetical protein pVco7_gp111 [Vibrio phage pVco-7]|uniref:Virion-encapsulated RNA polymerase n=1 Tax=Vibrio phage pVco-5 TaxID=1965485 RepID=A0A1W6JV15_9CAUD|nr:virion RNA polymerase [Vibrio phage pVco-5]ARM71100.1 virion-encapsulated RNA polymerase [Vibrio phage pVco-5]
MPNTEFMDALSNDVNSRMGQISNDAQASLLSSSYVEDINRANRQAAIEDMSFGESAVNIGKSFIEGVTRGLSESVTTGAQAEGAKLLQLPDEVIQAYNTVRNPNATEEERAKALDKLAEPADKQEERRGSSFGQFGAVQALARTETYAERIDAALAAQKQAKDIVDAATSLVDINPGNRNKMAADMAPAMQQFDEAWKSDDLSAIAKAGQVLGATLDTIRAAIENPAAIAEYSVESLGQAPFGIIGSAGYSGTVFADAIADYQEKNDGKLPSAADMQEMAAWSVGAGALDRIGDASLVKSAKKASQTGAQTLKETLKGLGKSAVTEGATEAAQTAIEEDVSKLREVQDYGKLLEAGVIGAAAGTTIEGGAVTAKAVKETTTKAKTSLQERNKAFVEKRDAKKSAIESGDVSAFTDTTSDSFSLGESVEVLSKAAAKNPEKREEFYQTAREQTLAKNAEVISLKEELIELGSKESPTEADATRVQEIESELSTLEPEVAKAADTVRAMRVEATPDAATVEQDVQAATTGDVEAAKRSFGSFRVDPESLTADQADAIANADNGLTESENTELRAYATVQRSLETLSTVGSHIVDGGVSRDTGREMLGIRDYQDMVFSGNQDTANKGLQGLKAFADRHTAKADNIEQAYATYQQTKEPQKVDIGSGKQLTIDARSRNLVGTVRQEANALNDAYAAMSPVVTPVAQPTEPVQTQAEEVTPTPEPVAEPEAVQEQPTEQAPTEGTTSVKVGARVYNVTGDSIIDTTTGEEVAAPRARQQIAVLAEKQRATAPDTVVVPDEGIIPTKTLSERNKEVAAFVQSRNEALTKVNEVPLSEWANRARQANPALDTSAATVEGLRLQQEAIKEVYDRYPNSELQRLSTAQEQVAPESLVEQTSVSPEPTDVGLATELSSPAVPAQPVPDQIKDYSLAKELTSKEDTTNLVSEYFNAGNKKSALNKVNDFGTRLKNDTTNTLEQVYEGAVPTEAEVVARSFANFNQSFTGALDSVFEVKEDYLSDDYVQYLVDESGQLPANVKTAMAVGAYEWVIASGKESTIQTYDSIRNLLGLSDEDYVEPELVNVIPTGTRRTSIINSLGTAAFKTLNLKMAPTAPVDAQTRLETAMGLWAYEALRKADVLQEAKPVKGSAIKNVYGVGAPRAIQDLEGSESYVMTQLNLTPGIERVIETNREKSSFMSDVFGSVSERPMPSFKAPKGTTTVSKSTQKVPESQRKILEEDQKKPYYLRQDTVGSFFEFEDDLRKEMLGYVSDTSKIMDVTKAGVDGANRAIERELEIAQEWYQEVQNQTEGIDTPFYLPHTVWKQGRMGIGTRFNPQSSKIHRYMTNRGEWNTTFDFNTEGENYFLLAVGEGFDIEVPKFASDSNGTASQKALEKLNDVLAKEDIRNAIDAMKSIMAGNNTRENQEAVAKGVKAGEGKMKSYLSIVEMAKYENAKASGETSFSHNLAREVDGITNGVAITTLQFSSDNLEQMFTQLQRMGMYDTDLTYNEWQANPANKDSYKSLAENWQRAIEAEVQNQPALQKQYVELSKLFGSFGKLNEEGEMEVTSDGRKIAKGPLMTSIYGAGIATIADHLGSQAIDKIYANLQKAYDTQNTQLVRETLATVNALTGNNYKITKGSQILEFKLTKKDIRNLKQATANVYQAPLKDAMESEYEVSFNARTQLNAAANLAHELFMGMYENEIGKYETLTNEVQQQVLEQLKPVTPIVNTANSKLSSKNLDTQLNTGLMLSGFEMVPAPKEVKVSIKSTKLKGKKSSTSGGQLRSFKAPGAAPIPTMTQSIDAATQVQMLKNATILNVHDASYISGNNFGSDKEKYNQGFLSINYQYSIPQEIAQMLSRVVDGYVASGLEVPPEALKAASKSILGTDTGTLEQLTSAINGLATDHMQNKQKVMKAIVRSEQYSNGEDSAFVPKHKFGSSPQRVIEDNFTFDDTRSIDSMTTERVFEELQKVSVVKDSTNHFEHLRNVINDVVNQAITPFNLHIGSSTETETIGSTDGTDMYIVNQVDGALPKSGSLANGIRMSSSEVFAHELVHNVSMVGVEQQMQERNELVALWNQAKKVVTPRDFMNDPQMSESDPTFKDEYEAAQQRWNHVFKPTVVGKEKGRRRSNHLHEFVALGVTNENFIKALSKIEYANKADELNTATGSVGKLAQRVYNFFRRMLSALQSRMLSTYGKTADKQLEELFKAFAGVDTSAKNALKAKTLRVVKPAQNFIETQVERAVDTVFADTFKKFSDKASAKVKEAVKSGNVQTLTSIIETGYNKLRKSDKSAAELFLSLATEARGRYNYVGILHDMKRLANKNIDRFRMQVRTDYRTAINEAFKEKLTVEQRQALSYGLLKTDLSSLGLTDAEALALVANRSDLTTKIKELEAKAMTFQGYGNYYIRQAKNLGQFMMTGKSYIPNAMLNAQNIADAIGTHRSMPKHARNAEPVIDALATLYAIQAMPTKDKQRFNALVQDDLDGVIFSLNLTKELHKRSKEEFKDNSRHMVKGFMTDKVDPNVAIKVGTLDEQADMEDQGYSLGEAVPKDPNDPDKTTKYLYVNNYGGIPANIGGVSYLMTDTHRGTDVVQSTTSSHNVVNTSDFDAMASKARLATVDSWTSNNLTSRTYSAPLVNQNGDIVNYRYVMSDKVKDDILHRDSSFDDLMGIMMSNLAVKDDMRKQNEDLTKVLRKMYDEDKDNRDDYVSISPRSASEEHREIYRLLPEDMKEAIAASWGGKERLYVRRDVVDLLFGYHKYTAANIWQLDKEERNVYQKLFTNFVEMIFGKKAALRVRQGEELMTALAKAVKDIIVIKSGVVTLGNMLSNVVLLKMMGVPLVDILKGHKDSFKAMRQYKDLNQELEQVRIKLGSPTLSANQRTVYESRLIELEDEMAANPVVDMIDQGLLSTIVEDVDTEVEEYKLRQKVNRKLSDIGWQDRIEDATNRIPQGVRDVAKEALVMQGSNLYDFLSEAAQFSDFGARYVLYKKKLAEGMEPDVAAGYVMDIFIDYDLPTHKGVQYLNDLGLLMFSKYLIRVQRIIAKTFAENPARATIIMLLQNFFGDIPDIMDSTMIVETNPLTRIANPVESFLGAAPDIVTMKPFS